MGVVTEYLPIGNKKLKYTIEPDKISENGASIMWKVTLKYAGKQFTTRIASPSRKPFNLRDTLSILLSHAVYCQRFPSVDAAMAFFESTDREDAQKTYTYYHRSLQGIMRLFQGDKEGLDYVVSYCG